MSAGGRGKQHASHQGDIKKSSNQFHVQIPPLHRHLPAAWLPARSEDV